MAIKVYSPIDFEDTSSGLSIDGDFAVDTSTFFVDVSTDRVGVGTSSPAYKLHVTGDAILAGASKLYLRDSLTYITESSGLILDSGHSTRATKFLIGGSEKLRIHTDGNVGVGTSSPAYKLSVIGTGFFTADSSTGRVLRLRDKSGDNSNIIQFESFNGSSIWEITGRSSTFYIYKNSGTGSGYKYQIDSSGNHSFDSGNMYITNGGNVGIGTTSPAAQLHVYSSGNGEIEVQRASGALINLQAQASLAAIGTDSNHPLYLKTNSATRAAILTNGNVGIGTISPDQKLHVSGNTKTTNLYVAGDIIHDGDADTKIQFNTDIINFDTAGVERLRIDAAGNVGVGTSSPARTLHVKKTGDNEVARFESDQTTSYIELEDANTTGQILIGTQGDNFKIHTAGSERMRITSGGNVLIGTNTDSGAKLDVKVSGASLTNVIRFGDATPGYLASGTSGVYLSDSSGTARFMFKHTGEVGVGTSSPQAKMQISSGNNSATQMLIGEGSTYGAPSIRFAIASTNYMGIGFTTGSVIGNEVLDAISIQRTGNVGIGTTSPSNKLHIVGDFFLKGSDTSSSTKNFQVQTGNGTSIMDFRNDAYAFFGCGQGGGSATGFIFRYNSTFGVQFTGYNYGNGTSPSYKPILMDTDLAGRSQGVYVNYGITGYTAPAPTSDTEFAVRGRGTGSNYTAKFEDSSTNPLLYIKDNGNVTVGTATDSGYKLDVEGNTNTNGDYYVNNNQGWSGTITIDQSPNPSIDITVEGGIITNVT